MDEHQSEHVRHVFDSYCRHVLKNAANDHYDKVNCRNKYFTPLEDCWDVPSAVDTYVFARMTYRVLGEEIQFTDEDIIRILNSLSEENRLIVLAACVCELPDRVIAEHLHMVRRTLTARKNRLLMELRRLFSYE